MSISLAHSLILWINTMYMNYDQIAEFCSNGGLLGYDPECINAASIDLRIGSNIEIEVSSNTIIDYSRRDKMDLAKVQLKESGSLIRPGQFFLAHTIEQCNFPDDVAALFRIKSSMGRIGLEHMDAGWVDPGFNGSLTLEFKNVTNNHTIMLRPGDRIGQLILFKGDAVSADKSYRTKGNYNGAEGVKQIGFKDE